MACDTPLTAYVLGTKENGKKDISFQRPQRYSSDIEEIRIPCGQCLGCRLDYSKTWADRCMLELQYHDSAYFITLTYNEEHVPKSMSSDPATGEAGSPTMTLYKRDFQLFIKRLRKRFPNDNIRYFACGEYGEKFFRPHYHAIIYGLHLDDLEISGKSPAGYQYYESKKLSSCWVDSPNRYPKDDWNYTFLKDADPEQLQLGFVSVGDVTWETCAYTARYILKKQKGVYADFYTYGGIIPEFTLMSRKPGIARRYFDDNKEKIYGYDYVSISTEQGGRRVYPSRYYDTMFDLENPEEMERIKKRRKVNALHRDKIKLARTSLQDFDLRAVEARNKSSRVKKLRRSYENGT